MWNWKKKRELDEGSENSSGWNVNSACWQIHLRRIQPDGTYTGGIVRKWDFQEPLKHPNTLFYLLVGTFFKFNGRLPRFKLLLEFYRRSWKLINLSSSKNLAWLGPNAWHKTFDFLTGKLCEFDLETWHGKYLIMVPSGCKVKLSKNEVPGPFYCR